jgi:hypothetical protein
MAPSAFLSPARRFAGIVNGLFQAIGVRRDAGLLAGPVAMLLWTRLARLRGRIIRLAERLASGKGVGVPRRSPTPRDTSTRRDTGRTQCRPQQLVPRGTGWLIRLVPEAAAAGSQLQHLLADPEMAALVQAAPQLGRLLRPLCRSLAVQPPQYLLPERRPRAPRAPRPEKPRPEKPRPERPRPARLLPWPVSRWIGNAGLPWPLQSPPPTPPPPSPDPPDSVPVPA